MKPLIPFLLLAALLGALTGLVLPCLTHGDSPICHYRDPKGRVGLDFIIPNKEKL